VGAHSKYPPKFLSYLSSIDRALFSFSPSLNTLVHVPPPRTPTQAVPTRTLLAKSVKAFLAQTYSDEVKPVDVFKTSALEYSIDGEDPREVRPCALCCVRPEVGARVGVCF
jgi:hypothetical protein